MYLKILYKAGQALCREEHLVEVIEVNFPR